MMQEPTPELIQIWKNTYEQNRSTLSPNKLLPEQVISYVKSHYPWVAESSTEARSIIAENVLSNEYFAGKLKPGRSPDPVMLLIPEEGGAIPLYAHRDSVYAGSPIHFGIDFESGYVFVEGSDDLADELTAYQGLDETDLQNFFLVANYVRCRERYPDIE